MQETIFKLHLKKWTEALAILETNTSNLHADELEAIGALKNLWRTVSFGSSCTQRVERMVKVLSDADKLHGNNRDIIQASKDFRGVAKEMYTTDAETLEQFRNALQQAMGGPRRTTQRPIRQPQQAYQQPRQQPQQRPQQPLRRQPQQRPASEHRYSRKPSSSAEMMRQARREERIRNLHGHELSAEEDVVAEIARYEHNIALADAGRFNEIDNKSRSGLKHDPIEWSRAYEEVIDEVSREADAALASHPRGMGFCFADWYHREQALSARGIAWKNPHIMNPRVMFD